MTSLASKWILGKAVGKINVGKEEDDPFYEVIPKEELGIFQRQGAKRKKPLPQGLSKNDAKILKSTRSRAYHLDLAFSCCCGIQVGWAGLIGLIPWIGDFIAVFFAYSLVQNAKKIDGGLPAYIETQMMANVAFDFGIGLIPIVGDLINIAYKANTRNCVLLEHHLMKSSKPNGFGNFHGHHASDDVPLEDQKTTANNSKPQQPLHPTQQQQISDVKTNHTNQKNSNLAPPPHPKR